ncbi:dehydrogenase [Calidifontimicrobium sp. SYSU G02091]|uniref:dehydrogenase n=1 Tax=Calidifontimicrobium sp. SYSU G02091 TaxID=2926421 RepID=UPI001F539E11|nr:dehydrogenase [Calidifontimicrobium sp. SYSU G02091]MCI1190858.1 dehydrogenase [Calidifontimicrobium sp. SYSU G02091]
MKTVVGISLGSSRQDFEFTTRFLGQRLNVRRIGTNGSIARALKLVKQWDGQAAAIGVGLVKDSDGLGARADHHAERLAAAAETTPVTAGGRLADILQEWAVRHAQAELGHYFDNARVLFFSGLASRKLAQTMSEYTENLRFADPVLQLGVPKLLGSLDALQLYATGAHLVAEWVPPRLTPAPLLAQWSRHVLRHALHKCTVVVAPVHELDDFGAAELAGKTVVTSTVSDRRLAALANKGVQMVIDGAPVIDGHVIAPDLLHAMIVAVRRKPPQQIVEDDLLEILAELQLAPRILYPNGFKRVNRFAFVIHPLSQEYFKVVKPVEILSQVSPPLFMDTLEKVLAYAPPFVYSTVTGIKSPTGVEAEGWLISVGGTPHEIMSHPPEFTYKRLLAAAEMARKLGAQIMGLGAFTKIVGDAGVTVARRAPLPITTGNSYSASAALWAAHDALRRLALLPPPDGDARVKFKAMVVGATGSIGAACARLLARAAEEIYLVSPETAKLLALKESILKESPGAIVHLAARTDRHIGEMDMIVTATSGAGQKVLDIMKVKPGCVITDVARPLDLPPEEVVKRPDVLVIESGEIQLPGEPKMKNIGLPPGVTYACLAETIVLALEGRFENFTVGRHIEWEKVREIYKLGLKHGMKLAAISGVHGVITDEQIARVRELALAARAADAARAARPPRAAKATKAAKAANTLPQASRAPAARRRTVEEGRR